jgi:hypothetical protein
MTCGCEEDLIFFDGSGRTSFILTLRRPASLGDGPRGWPGFRRLSIPIMDLVSAHGTLFGKGHSTWAWNEQLP